MEIEKLEKVDYITESCLVQNPLYFSLKDLLICPLCHKILKNPFMCSKCQSTYCKKCLEDFSNMKKCPNDNEESEFTLNKMKNELLSKLKYKCKNCQKEVTQDDIKEHLEGKCKPSEVEREKTLAEEIKNRKQLIKLSEKEVPNKEISNKLTSKIYFIKK